ncbi:MAG: hypothetical protein PHO26_06875 [Dehalococcoidia bacterium]|nr:hypothetical protein [Dehalococcoidia bacterium]MDD5495446.1 hypothetical protein [Dehalococcoidia bacterium]
MELSSWRDIILIIWGSVATVGIVFIAAILFLFYRKTISVLESTDLVVAKAGNIVDFVNQEVVEPVSRLGAMIQGITQGISIFSSIFKKKEENNE